MCFTDESGQLQVCQIDGPTVVQPRTEEEQQKSKRPRVDDVERERNPEVIQLQAKQAEHDKRLQDLTDRIEGTNTRITTVMGQLGKMTSE